MFVLDVTLLRRMSLDVRDDYQRGYAPKSRSGSSPCSQKRGEFVRTFAHVGEVFFSVIVSIAIRIPFEDIDLQQYIVFPSQRGLFTRDYRREREGLNDFPATFVTDTLVCSV